MQLENLGDCDFTLFVCFREIVLRFHWSPFKSFVQILGMFVKDFGCTGCKMVLVLCFGLSLHSHALIAHNPNNFKQSAVAYSR